MLPQETKNQNLQLFELSENKLIQNRQLMLQVPEVKNKLSNIDSLITTASTNVIIKDLKDDYIINQISTIVPLICRDLGIKKWYSDENDRKYVCARFMKAIKRFYSNLSLNSIVLAFELLSVGELDEFLPKDKNNHPDKNHYQEFSYEFYTRVLNAYIKKTSEVWAKVRLSVPKIELQISDQEKKNLTNEIIEEIFLSFDNYKKNNSEPNFDLEVHLNVLIENKLIEKIPFDKENLNKAYNRLLISNHISKIERKKMIDYFERKQATDGLKLEAQRIENNLTIKKYFDLLISEEKNIRDALKKIN
jgi:hypothetical protein